MNKKITMLFVLGICACVAAGCSSKKQKTHDYTLVEEIAATCTEDGVKAHYECIDCDKVFDMNKNEVTKESLVIEKLGHLAGQTWYEKDGYHYHLCQRCSHKMDVGNHELHEVSATASSHIEDGDFGHYKCDICDKKFLDSYGLVEISQSAVAPSGHDEVLTFHPEVPATCENAGVKAYYSCSCGALFEDAEGTKSIENPIVIPALGHISNGVWKSDGTKHWHECFRCGEVFDEHEHVAGNESYQDLSQSWKLCSICNHKMNVQDLVFSGCHHNRLMHYDGVQPTFTKPGHI